MISGNDPLAFAKLMPNFDFIRQFSQAATGASGAPNFANWIAPTVSVEELDKRITDLKAVQFWLEQSLQAIRATTHALEVQKMTLAALQHMNLSMADMAKVFAVPELPADGTAKSARSSKPVPGVPDPLHWWDALTQQFQAIAANALNEAAQTMPPAPAGPTDPVPAAQPARKAAKAKPAASKKKAAPRRSGA